MRLYLSDDSDEVLEQTLSPLVGDHSCCHIAEDVGTACLDSIQVAGQWRGVRRKENTCSYKMIRHVDYLLAKANKSRLLHFHLWLLHT